MKKTILCSALFIIMGSQVQADTTPQPTPPVATPQTPAAIQTLPAQAAQPAAQVPALNPEPTEQTQAVQPQPAPVINCDYKIPAATKKLDQSLVMTWAEKALVQSFDFNSDSVDAQLQKLKSCFTDQGWEGFNSALQKSGNIEAIKSQKLKVSSQIDGQVSLTETKENQWDMTLPLQVVYQNDKEKVTQLLQVDLSLGRKISGDLGIIKLIASPRQDAEKAKASIIDSQTTPATATTQESAPSSPIKSN